MSQEKIRSEMSKRKQNQGLSRQELINNVRNRTYSEPQISPDELRDMIQKYDPSFTRVLSDAEKAERADLTKQAQDAILNYFSQRTETTFPGKFDYTPTRHELHFFDYSGTPEADEHNQRAAEILKNGTPQEQGSFVYDYVMSKSKPIAEMLLKADTRDIINNYAQYYEHIAIITEIATIAKFNKYNFTPEQTAELQKLENLQTAMSEIPARIDVVALPMYQHLPLEDFVASGQVNTFSLEMDLNALAKGKGEVADSNLADPPLMTLASNMRGHATYYSEVTRSLLEYEIASNNGDSRMIYDFNGKRIPSDRIGESLQSGKTLFAAIPGKGMTPVFTNPKSVPPAIFTNPEDTLPRMAGTLAENTKALLQQVNGANPWWMVTGSKQFSDMEKAMDAFVKLAESVTYPLDTQQTEAMRNAAIAIQTTSADYLAYKMGQPNAKISADPNTGLYVGKNDRETARLRAANQLTEIAEQLNFIIDCGSNPEKTLNDALTALKQEDQKAIEVQRAKDAANQKKTSKQTLPEHEQCKSSKEVLLEKTEPFRGTLQKEFDGDLLPELQKECLSNAETMAKVAAANHKSESRNSEAYDTMAKLCTLHLVKMERMQWKQEHPGEPLQIGILEKNLLQGRVSPSFQKSKPDPTTGAETNVFQNLVGPMTPARMEQFLLNAEYKTLGTQYLEALGKQAPNKDEISNTAKKDEISKSNEGNNKQKSEVLNKSFG